MFCQEATANTEQLQQIKNQTVHFFPILFYTLNPIASAFLPTYKTIHFFLRGEAKVPLLPECYQPLT